VDEDPVLVERHEGWRVLTLNRPERLNSFNETMHERLMAALIEAEADEGCRALLLTGAGRGFCAGQDLTNRVFEPGVTPDLTKTIECWYNPLVRKLRSFRMPIVCAVNGVAAGAGASIAFACDLRIVADTAGFNLAFANIALSCDTGSSFTLQRLIGRAKAIELLYFPRTVPADEALALGLATHVVPTGELWEVVDELAARLATGPTVAFAALRQSVTYAADHTFAEAVANESAQMTRTGATADHAAAVAAFLAKEQPVFEGR
jgi:2-(1,2-epoxy-1,2-dihydrophenyl)acetyl-CoA isomerase